MEQRKAWLKQKEALSLEEEQLAPLRDDLTALRAARLGRLRDVRQPARPRLGVCIIGQMARLDLVNKVDLFFRPNRERVLMDVVFVLAPPGEVHFVNARTDVGGRMNWTAESIRSTIGDALGNGTLTIDDRAQEKLPFLNAAYVLNLDNKQNQPIEWLELRASSHVRQWYALYTCHARFVRMAAARREPYDVFLKLRDDSHMIAQWQLPMASVWRGAVLTKSCSSWQVRAPARACSPSATAPLVPTFACA
jgi:hypothetical protein